jgi:hypothetical protein
MVHQNDIVGLAREKISAAKIKEAGLKHLFILHLRFPFVQLPGKRPESLSLSRRRRGTKFSFT